MAATTEDTKKIVANRQAAIVVTVGFTFLVNSLALGFSSPALPLLREDSRMKVSEEEASWVAAIVPFGAIFGSIVASYFVDWFGRRNLLFASVLLFMGSWIQIAVSYSIMVIIIARFVAGFCVGLTSSSGSVYLAETIQEDFRPTQGIIMGVFGTSGIFFMAILVLFVKWRGLAWAGAILCLPPLFFIVFLPESPYYLYKFSHEKTRRAYAWLLVTDSDSQKKLKEMKNVLKILGREKNNSLFSRTNMYPTCVLMTLHGIQQFTGINVFIFFSTTIFSRIGGDHIAEFSAILMTAVNIISNLISSFYQGYKSRQFLLMLSSKTVVTCLWIIAIFFIMKDSKRFGTEFPLTVTVIPVTAIMVYIASFAIGWGPVPFLFMGEGLPSTIRGNATGKAMALNWAAAFLTTKSFSWLSGYIGYGWMFLIYSMFTVGGGIAMEIYMPETLGKSVTEIDSYYIEFRGSTTKHME